MRLAIACLALLAVAATSPSGCGKEPYQPCAGKRCGESCAECAPGDHDCVETAVVKACDAAGTCTAAGAFTCSPPDPCAGRSCGDECTIDPPCRWSTPPCMAPSALGHCDGAGACVQDAVSCAPPPVEPCAGKKCGDSCNPCGDAAPCPTFAATACDRAGQCVTATPWLCYDACAGKKCGERCSICPPDAADCGMVMCLTACDGAGRCTCAGGGAACP
jgi:hypothetical protein